MNIFQRDQAQVQNLSNDIDNLLDRLDRHLFANINKQGIKLISKLTDFIDVSEDKLLSPELIELASRIHRNDGKILNLWVSIDTILYALSQAKGISYEICFLSTSEKIRGILTANVCANLDNYLFSYSKGSDSHGYYFRKKVIKLVH